MTTNNKNKESINKHKSIQNQFQLWTKTELFQYGPTRGTILFTPRSTAIWKLISSSIDKKFIQDFGIQNVMFPALIPLSLFEKEIKSFSGFSPELFKITESGNETLPLEQQLVLRPTSEPIFSMFFKNILESYRQLPLKFNQWSNVWRAEKSTNPFYRTSEFHWQEGHGIFAEQANLDLFLMGIHKNYQDFFQEVALIHVFAAEKPVTERFPGAERTWTNETLLPDGQFLQLATTHDLGTNFSRLYDIKYTTATNEIAYPLQCSWGTSTRILAAILATHADKFGVFLPPSVADIQVQFVGIWTKDTTINNAIQKQLLKLARGLTDADFRVGIESFEAKSEMENRYPYISGKESFGIMTPASINKSWSYRASEWFERGIPIVIVIGNRELENGEAICYSRLDWFTKKTTQAIKIVDNNEQILLINCLNQEFRKIKLALMSRANKKIDSIVKIDHNTTNPELVIKEILTNHAVNIYLCAVNKCELETSAKISASPRFVVDSQSEGNDSYEHNCFNCGLPASQLIVYGRAY